MSGGLLVIDSLDGDKDGDHRQVSMNSDGGCCGWVYDSRDGLDALREDIALLEAAYHFLRTGNLNA